MAEPFAAQGLCEGERPLRVANVPVDGGGS